MQVHHHLPSGDILSSSSQARRCPAIHVIEGRFTAGDTDSTDRQRQKQAGPPTLVENSGPNEKQGGTLHAHSRVSNIHISDGKKRRKKIQAPQVVILTQCLLLPQIGTELRSSTRWSCRRVRAWTRAKRSHRRSKVSHAWCAVAS